MNDHDIIVEMNIKLDELKLQFSNHLRHHFQYSFYIFTVCIGLIVTLVVLLLN